jgi:hypothetical protein
LQKRKVDVEVNFCSYFINLRRRFNKHIVNKHANRVDT